MSPQILWPDHCVQDTPGAAFAPELDLGGIHHVVQKGTLPEVDSYSGFFDNGGAHATGLEALLREQQIEEVTVVGLATDYCVRFTALDAARLGFRTNLLPQRLPGASSSSPATSRRRSKRCALPGWWSGVGESGSGDWGRGSGVRGQCLVISVISRRCSVFGVR